jgi:hypothetical protein
MRDGEDARGFFQNLTRLEEHVSGLTLFDMEPVNDFRLQELLEILVQEELKTSSLKIAATKRDLILALQELCFRRELAVQRARFGLDRKDSTT